MEKNKTRVHVLGEDFLIRTDKSEEFVNSVMQLLKQKIAKIREMAGEMSNLRTAILAGLLLAEEVTELGKKAAGTEIEKRNVRPQNEQEEEIAAIASRLIGDLDDIIQ